jgi:hypothetical protein
MKSRRMRWMGHMTSIGEKRNTYRILMEKPEFIRDYFEDLVLNGKDNIKIDLIAVGWEIMKDILLVQDRDKLQDAVKININFRVS